MLVKVGVMGGSGNERKGKFFRGVTIYNNNIGDNFNPGPGYSLVIP